MMLHKYFNGPDVKLDDMFQVVPSIDLRDGKVVRLQQGDYSRQLNYDLDPVKTAESFQAAGAQWMHIVDLDGAKVGSIAQSSLIERIIKSTSLNVQVGGGVRSDEDIRRLLGVGASRVVVGTRAIQDWPWFTELAHHQEFAGKLVLAIDARDGRVATHGWTQTTSRLAVDIARDVCGWPIAGLLYTDVAKDGMLQGPNLETTRELAQSTDVPVIASGGVGGIEHIKSLLALPVWGVIVGRSLHDGRLDLGQAVSLARTAPRTTT